MKLKYKISFKKLIIVIDIIAVILIIFFVIKNKKDFGEIKNSGYYSFEYKIFTFSVPKYLNFKSIDKKQFKINGSGWYALVEPYVDREHYIYDFTGILYKNLLEEKIDLEEPIKIMVDNSMVVVFNRNDNKSLLCYLEMDKDVFGYIIEIFNDDKSFNNSALDEIVSILMNAELNYGENEESTYQIIDFSEYVDDNSLIVDENPQVE